MENVQRDLKSDQYQQAAQKYRDMVITLKVREGKEAKVDVLLVEFM